MASDAVNITEDAEMADYDGDKVVTMMDVLQEQQEFEDDANAVLGASDDKNCTFAKGYIKRQALYACLTCCTEAKTDPTKRAGVCLACSLTCHENHELIELYTKRNFRCDCGNPNFNTHPCQFTSTKTDLNEDNIYNQNFSGLYCTCHRPYPDPDSTFEDDMIQCIICEDWLHASHLEATVPANDLYSEMVCKGCMEKNEFLHDYTGFAVNLENGNVDIITVNGDAISADNSLCNGDLEKEKLVNGVDSNETGTKATDDIKLNGDVEINDDSKTSEENSEIPENTSTGNTASSPTSEQPSGEVQVELSSDVISTQSKHSELEQTETEEEQSEENTAQPVKNKDITLESQEPSVADDKDPNTQSEEKAELIEPMENDNKAPSTNGETSTTTSETENMTTEDNVTKKHTETEEQNKEKPTNLEQENGDSATETSEKTEQALDKPRSPTSDKLTSENDAPSEEKHIDVPSEEKHVDAPSEEKHVDAPLEEKHVDAPSEAKYLDAPVEASNVSRDSTQTEQLKENAEDKPDSVMDAIDELLDTANSDTKQENKNDVNASTDTKENTESIDSKASDDVEMSSMDNKPDDNASECTEKTEEAEDKSSADVEMSDSAEQDKPQVTENNIDTESVDSTKDVDNIAATDVKIVEENKMEETVEENLIDKVEKSAEETTLIRPEKSSTETEEKVEQTSENIINENETEDANKAADVKENTCEHKRKLSESLSDDDISSKKAKLETECVRPQGVKRVHKGATFWPSTFRQKLCTCGECISMYKDLNVLFLTDLEDTVSAYESLGKENSGGASQYEKGLEALSSLDRIQQINALTEYNKMRDKLLDFLKSFKDRKEIVKEEDIKAFFAGMKPRREPDGVYFCR